MRGYVGDTSSAGLLARIRAPHHETGLALGQVVVRGRLAPWLRREEGQDSPMSWFYDNGAWEDHVHNRPFDDAAFLRDVDLICRLPRGRQPAFLVLPDRVAGGMASLDLSLRWLERLRGITCWVALAVQDGMTPEAMPIRDLYTLDVLFVGGSTDWKLRTAPAWARWARYHRDLDVMVHVGRVGSAKRVRAMRAAGVWSVDSSVPLFAERNWQVWTDALRSTQLELFEPGRPGQEGAPVWQANRLRSTT